VLADYAAQANAASLLVIYDELTAAMESLVGASALDLEMHCAPEMQLAERLTCDFYGLPPTESWHPNVLLMFEACDESLAFADSFWDSRVRAFVLTLHLPRNGFAFECYQSIPFFLFHEYASHIFTLPVQTCLSKSFILDGWLLATEYKFFQSICLTHSSLTPEHYNAALWHVLRSFSGGRPEARRGFELGMWFNEGVGEVEPSQKLRVIRDLVRRGCSYNTPGDFHMAFFRRLNQYYRRSKGPAHLRKFLNSYDSVDGLFAAL
jgi:hypothetical protein